MSTLPTLIQELEALIDHLEKYGETTWASIFKRYKMAFEKGNIHSLDHLTKMRGGMGSFSDLVICQLNGHKVEKENEDYANTVLTELGNSVFMTANELRRKINALK